VITNGLGLRYLRIDVLCILQDIRRRQESADWDDAGNMYTEIHVTIIAAYGESIGERFLHRDRPRKVPNTRISYRYPGGNFGTVWIAAEMDTDSG